MAPDLDAYRDAARRCFYRKADLAVPDEALAGLAAERRAAAERARPAVAAEAARVLGLPRCEATAIDGGTLHAVLRVTAGGRPGWYARTSLPSLPAPAGELLAERIAVAAARAAGVPAPRVVHVDLSRERVPFDLALVEAAAGEPLAPGAGGDAALAALGRVLAALHDVRGRGFGPLDPDGRAPSGLLPSWREFVLGRLGDHLDACRRDGTLAAPAEARARAALRAAEPVLDAAPAALCHGDLGRPNVLTRAGEVAALLDWEDALVGDPLFDLAGWGTFVGHDERRAVLLAGYAERAPLPADADLRYRLYYLRIMLAKTVHRRRFGWAATDRIPAAARLAPAIDALESALGRGA